VTPLLSFQIKHRPVFNTTLLRLTTAEITETICFKKSSDFVIVTGSKSNENYPIFATSRNTNYMVSLSVSLERTAPYKL